MWGFRPEPIDAQSVRPGQHMIFSTESAFRLYPSFLKVAEFQFLRLRRKTRQVDIHEVYRILAQTGRGCTIRTDPPP